MSNYEEPAELAVDDELQLESIVADERRMVCGYPKTGRTWLRFMMGVALSEEYDLDADIDLNNVYSIVPNDSTTHIPGQPAFAYQGTVPKIEMSHKPYDAAIHDEARVMFMTRDPRDVMVSHWRHDSLQVKIFEGNLSDYVRDPVRGIGAFLTHLETWSPHLQTEQIVTYEAMRAEPAKAVSKIFKGLAVEVSDASIETAVASGEINRMRRIEVERGIAGHDYDRSNPEARRVRAGKVGGFRDYLGAADLSYIAGAVAESSEATQRVLRLTPYED